MIDLGLDDNFEVKGNITEHFSIEFQGGCNWTNQGVKLPI